MLAACLSVACMSCMKAPAIVTLFWRVVVLDEPGWSAGTEQTPRSFRWFKEGNDEGLVRKPFIVAAWGSDADRCKASLVVYFVTDGCVVVNFVPAEISQSSGQLFTAYVCQGPRRRMRRDHRPIRPGVLKGGHE